MSFVVRTAPNVVHLLADHLVESVARAAQVVAVNIRHSAAHPRCTHTSSLSFPTHRSAIGSPGHR